MPSLHVALGPDLRRPSVRLFKVIPFALLCVSAYVRFVVLCVFVCC